MSMGIGIGIGLPFTQNPVVPPTNADFLTPAILGRFRVKARHNGKRVVMEPYALYRSNGTTFLNAVVIYAEAKRVRKFKPQDFDISTLSEITVTEDPFFPNWAFNPDTILPQIIVAVELIEYGQDGQQPNAGSLVS